MSSASRHRERLLLPLLVALAALGVLLYALFNEHSIARERVGYEDEALARVRALAAAERALHERTGRYGWLSDLQQAGVLDESFVPVTSGSEDPHVSSVRYRIDVLLPFAVVPGELLRIAPRSAMQENPELERRHFAVVARPWGEALTGFRTFYMDEGGHVFVSEGVSDIESRTRRPLPELHLTHGLPQLPHGYHRELRELRWYRLDRLPER